MLNWDDPLGQTQNKTDTAKLTMAPVADTITAARAAAHDKVGHGQTGLEGIEAGASRVDVSEKRIIN
ncbi:MAG TPA: ribonucleotide-diphosphate reductase subunit beta, partial [Halothiobacillus sp.]|nr:ribonucleotide-diphosphate reductase subunit beta [Halothiobacillus sp.]